MERRSQPEWMEKVLIILALCQLFIGILVAFLIHSLPLLIASPLMAVLFFALARIIQLLREGNEKLDWLKRRVRDEEREKAVQALLTAERFTEQQSLEGVEEEVSEPVEQQVVDEATLQLQRRILEAEAHWEVAPFPHRYVVTIDGKPYFFKYFDEQPESIPVEELQELYPTHYQWFMQYQQRNNVQG